MSHTDCNVVLKYCEIIDEFIKVRIFSDDDISELLYVKSVPNKKAYQQLVINACIVNYNDEVLPLFKKVNRVYKLEALEELLYQICVEVNPHLEIHQVALPIEGDENGFGCLHLINNQQEKNKKEFRKKIFEMESKLSTMIIGQQQTVSIVSNAVKKAAVGLKAPNRPIGVFFLVGSTGTGKTEMAKATARHLFGDLTKLVRVDCSEYALPHEYAKLIGAPPGYIGHNEGGFLTEAVKEKKGCVILFDEIEKAHFKVHNLLLQIMDEGFLTDNKGTVVGFNHTIIFLTSNIGVTQVANIKNRMGFDMKKRQVLDKRHMDDAITEAMKDVFNPEFINRLDDMIVFNSLGEHDCVKIARNQLEEVASYLKSSEISLAFTSKVKKYIAKQGYNPEYGARELRRIIQKKIENPLSELILRGDFTQGDTIEVDVTRNKVSFSVRNATQEDAGDESDPIHAGRKENIEEKETVPVTS
ncbi:MAG: AAA family ATPase [Planctomycetota bacterium]